MANGLGLALVDDLLDHAFGGGDYSRPATIYLALMTTAHTGIGGGGTEVTTGSWTNYARKSMDNDGAGTVWQSVLDTQKYTNADIEFPAATVSGTAPVIVGWGLYSASTSGDLLAYGTISPSRTINNGDIFRVPEEQLMIQIT